jgi:hypothetical protein
MAFSGFILNYSCPIQSLPILELTGETVRTNDSNITIGQGIATK